MPLKTAPPLSSIAPRTWPPVTLTIGPESAALAGIAANATHITTNVFIASAPVSAQPIIPPLLKGDSDVPDEALAVPVLHAHFAPLQLEPVPSSSEPPATTWIEPLPCPWGREVPGMSTSSYRLANPLRNDWLANSWPIVN